MRKANVSRTTKETEIKIELNLDGSGKHRIATSIPFLDHMLTLFSAHGLFDLAVRARGDTEVDFHHTVEDIGISLGEALKQALGKKEGICRYGSAFVPMDESLASVHADLSGRPCLVYHFPIRKRKIGDFDTELVKEFLQAVVNQRGNHAPRRRVVREQRAPHGGVALQSPGPGVAAGGVER